MKSSVPQSCLKTKVFIAACLASFVLLFVNVFQWPLTDILTPFLMLPLFGFVFFIMLLVMLWSVVHAYKQRKSGRHALLPLSICIAAILATIYVPFTRIWITADFYLKKEEREEVVAKILSGQLLPNVSYNSKIITLPKGTSLSNGGNIVIERVNNEEPYVFFFTFRGILDNYSGFLWVPKNGEASKFQDAGETGTEISPFGGNWFFIGHR
ncbi:MAG: hypothetical protein WC782_16075 [Methylococcaceae bacterium]|jgi:hypothetical protein